MRPSIAAKKVREKISNCIVNILFFFLLFAVLVLQGLKKLQKNSVKELRNIFIFKSAKEKCWNFPLKTLKNKSNNDSIWRAVSKSSHSQYFGLKKKGKTKERWNQADATTAAAKQPPVVLCLLFQGLLAFSPFHLPFSFLPFSRVCINKKTAAAAAFGIYWSFRSRRQSAMTLC